MVSHQRQRGGVWAILKCIKIGYDYSLTGLRGNRLILLCMIIGGGASWELSSEWGLCSVDSVWYGTHWEIPARNQGTWQKDQHTTSQTRRVRYTCNTILYTTCSCTHFIYLFIFNLATVFRLWRTKRITLLELIIAMSKFILHFFCRHQSNHSTSPRRKRKTAAEKVSWFLWWF